MKQKGMKSPIYTWFVQLCFFGCFLTEMANERLADALISFFFLYAIQAIGALRAARGSDLIEIVIRLGTVGLVGITLAFYFFMGNSPDPVRGGIILAASVITTLESLLPGRAAKAPAETIEKQREQPAEDDNQASAS